MEKATAVDTCLGILNGRDCIYLNQVKRDDRDNLIFTGDINGHLVSRHRDEKNGSPTPSPFGGCWPILPANWTPMKIWPEQGI